MAGIDFEAYVALQKEIEALSRRKNKDYGSDSLTTFGNYGILVRLSDKFDRLKTLYKNGNSGRPAVQDEKVTDTLQDIINYSIYMILQDRGTLIQREKRVVRRSKRK